MSIIVSVTRQRLLFSPADNSL